MNIQRKKMRSSLFGVNIKKLNSGVPQENGFNTNTGQKRWNNNHTVVE